MLPSNAAGRPKGSRECRPEIGPWTTEPERQLRIDNLSDSSYLWKRLYYPASSAYDKRLKAKIE